MDLFGLAGVLTLGGLAWSGVHGGAVAPAPGVRIERLDPVAADRSIRTTSVSIRLWKRRVAGPLRADFGLVATHSSGGLQRLVGRYEAGTFRDEAVASGASGGGPAADLALSLASWPGADFVLRGSWALVAYDRRFPAGGSRLNGMFRLGPELDFDLGRDRGLTLGITWMHVSNGRGVRPENPGYEGIGPSVSMRWRF